jgi:serine/threonine protein phosphatase 1
MWGFFADKERGMPELPVGHRAYAIGDVHGRLDLLNRLLAEIESDNVARGPATTIVVFLGDLIDRGPDSAQVVDKAIVGLSWASTVCLKGNHEAAMLDALDGVEGAARMWLSYGGLETLASWGVSSTTLSKGDHEEIMESARAVISKEHHRWLSLCPVSYRLGDYYFVHAGVRPGVDLFSQNVHDQLWIRDEFLRSRRNHGALIVHGHSISAKVESLSNRIGVDTGAYASGTLTAVGLERSERWFLTGTVSFDAMIS